MRKSLYSGKNSTPMKEMTSMPTLTGNYRKLNSNEPTKNNTAATAFGSITLIPPGFPIITTILGVISYSDHSA